MNIQELGEFAMTKIPENVTLGEFKYLRSRIEFISTRNTNVTSYSNVVERGFGIRILKDGAWGFSATEDLTKTAVEVAINDAVSLANSASIRSPGVRLSNDPVVDTKVSTEYKIDPFSISPEEKIDYLLSCYEMTKDIPEIKFTNGTYRAQHDHMVFLNTEGTRIDQNVTWNGGFIMMIARGNADTQVRKYPDDQYKTLGWEHMKEIDIPGNIEPVAKELVQLLEAPQLKEDKTTIILNPSQLGLQLHESCGHPTELDRALGYEAAYAGTSFLKTDLLDTDFNYGSELVSINADATIPGALGTFPFDNEGVSGKNVPLVKEGKFVGYLTSRETAPLIGWEESGGATRSDGFDKIPLVRMTNIVLQPGEWDFDEMIEDTKSGYYFHTNRSWSIDDIRLNFQFGCEVGYKIENGEITGLVKNPTYTGITPEFWGSVSAVAKSKYSEVLGTPTCGKGEPGQTMYTGHGGPPARFENVRVGIMEA